MKIETADGRTLYSKEENSTRLMIKRILFFAGLIIFCIVIGYLIFTKFRNMSDARLALREAKNVLMSLEMVDMEYYGLGLNVYDEKSAGSIRSGAQEKVKHLQGDLKGQMRITGYDSSARTITGFEYELEKYLVRYTKYPLGRDNPENESSWQVFEFEEVLSY